MYLPLKLSKPYQLGRFLDGTEVQNSCDLQQRDNTERKDIGGRILKDSRLIPKDCFVFIVHFTKKCLLSVYYMTSLGLYPVRDINPSAMESQASRTLVCMRK